MAKKGKRNLKDLPDEYGDGIPRSYESTEQYNNSSEEHSNRSTHVSREEYSDSPDEYGDGIPRFDKSTAKVDNPAKREKRGEVPNLNQAARDGLEPDIYEDDKLLGEPDASIFTSQGTETTAVDKTKTTIAGKRNTFFNQEALEEGENPSATNEHGHVNDGASDPSGLGLTKTSE